MPVPVEEQAGAIRHPVGRLKPLRCNVNGAPVRGGHGNDFERTVERRRCGGRRLCSLQIYIREHRCFHHVFIVAAHAYPHVKRRFQSDPRGSARQIKFTFFVRQPQGEVRAAFFNPQPRRRGNIGLYFVGGRALLLAILQRGQTAAVQRRVGVRRIPVKALADHEHRFAMLVHALAEKRDVRRQRRIAGHFLPHELESIAGKPHILATASNGVAALRSVVFHGPRVKNSANVSMAFERAGPGWGAFRSGAVLGRAHQCKSGSQRRQPSGFLSVHGKSSHSARRRGNLRLAPVYCQFGLPFALDRYRLRGSIFVFAFISLFLARMLSSLPEGEFVHVRQ